MSVLLAALLLSSPVPDGYFPFVIPWDALAKDSAVDVSALNQGWAGAGGFIVPRGGMFVESRSGRRIRFFATNLGERAASPTKEDADRIAARMAQLGINLVRVPRLPGTAPPQLETLDYLVYAFKSHGIYVNLTLGSTREKADVFDRPRIEAQKEYARTLLDRTNRFTGMAYKDDPTLAFVEIHNEGSLVGRPGESPGEGLVTLPEPFLGEIAALWNAWLSGRYGDDARLVEAWGRAGPDESLERRTFQLGAATPSEQRAEDWLEFLVSTERAHAEEMRQFLTRDLGLRANLVGTQVQWGGLTALGREASMEYVDAHGYWQRPAFEGDAADPVHWTVGRVPLVNQMDREQGLLGELALERVAGKPFTVSEYDHPAPNDYRVEMVPLLSTFASLQDWDAFYTVAYPVTGTAEANDRIAGFFDSGLDPTKVAFYPSMSLLFRKGLVAPLAERDALSLPDRPWRVARDAADAWRQTGRPPDTLVRRAALALDGAPALRRQVTGPVGPAGAFVARHARGVTYTVDAQGAKVLTGFIGGDRFALSGITFAFPDFGRNAEGFGALTLVDLDGRDLMTTRRALLTLVGGAENSGMGWNEERTSVGDQWGDGPVVAEGIPCVISIPTARALRVFPLDASGKRGPPLAVTRKEERLTFRVGPESKTLWYEIADH
jgi:hypothetical protein